MEGQVKLQACTAHGEPQLSDVSGGKVSNRGVESEGKAMEHAFVKFASVLLHKTAG